MTTYYERAQAGKPRRLSKFGKRIGRPRNSDPDPEIAELMGRTEPKPTLARDLLPDDDFDLGDWATTIRPVSITWLMGAFRMDRLTVKKRLANLDPIKKGTSGSDEYDFVQAAQYLVKPKMDIATYLRNLKPNQMPPYFQDQWWAAQLKRQKYEQNACDLWETESVLEVFGETFMTIKQEMQLWSENLAESHNLTDDQRAALIVMVDGLQNSIYERLVLMPGQRRTENSIAAMERLINDTGLKDGEA